MIALVVTLEPSRIAWLPQFLKHYSRQGVHHFEVSVQFEPNVEVDLHRRYLEEARAAARCVDGVHVRSLVCEFDAMTVRHHHDQIQSRISETCRWIVWADIDEFQVYSAKLDDLVRQWEDEGANLCRGLFVDRIARDGILSEFEPARPIWAQYPIGADVTRTIVKGQTNKVVCSRSNVKIKYANHDPIWTQPLSWSDQEVPVFHFKWDASLKKRMRMRLTDSWKARCPWWVQTDRLMSTLADDGMRLPVASLECFDYRDDALPFDAFPYESNPLYRKFSLERYRP